MVGKPKLAPGYKVVKQESLEAFAQRLENKYAKQLAKAIKKLQSGRR